jgi:hypothetical protein
MKEIETFRMVSIPLTYKQAQEAFTCEECKGFSESLQYLKGFTDLVETYPEMDKAYHKHLTLVASPDCAGACVTGATMSFRCPCCKDKIYLNYTCYLPTEFDCPYCGAAFDSRYAVSKDEAGAWNTGGIHLKIQGHNSMKEDLEKSHERLALLAEDFKIQKGKKS